MLGTDSISSLGQTESGQEELELPSRIEGVFEISIGASDFLGKAISRRSSCSHSNPPAGGFMFNPQTVIIGTGFIRPSSV